MRFRIWFAITPGRAMLSAPVARSIPVRCDSRSVPIVDGRGSSSPATRQTSMLTSS